ncbi:Nse4-domain-containing protein [Mollisia scopiformis]|uniref:Non-structural maintenance of chromosomes element 4 n=1 Tax=Mollisia scopiformis TaxID=149040 RepID=A0A132B1Q0_MOLSC|nr:Nse4-domain-containing protein [Mollisia scopiformis]KUJ06305.1 Nse4-domain-containing protein [Mollisia scopiformis]
MAPITKMSESPAPFRDNLYDASPPPSSRRNTNMTQPSMSPSPGASVSSDKENRSSRPAVDKGKARAPMGPPGVPSMRDGNTRKRAAEQDQAGDRSRRRRTVEVDEDESELDYDPDQDREERRQLRKGLRNLTKTLNENRAEFLAPKSTGLRDTILKANELSHQVKQTSDATIDSRLLVTAADFSLKKTVALCSGDTAQGIDLDDFLMKVKQYMRKGAPEDRAPSNTQRHRRRGQDDDDEDDGDSWNWGYFGRHACVKHISRPSVPGFLLGPLSVEKRVRKPIVRQERLKHSAIKEVRPEVLQAGDIEKNENANLTTLCTQILGQLRQVQAKAIKSVTDRQDDNMTDSQAEELMDKYGVSTDGGIALFKFVINPFSFGQTIENMFYVSFLIRDGKVGIETDNRGLPYLEIKGGRQDEAGGTRDHKPKHQAVLALDMKQWKEMIDVFEITAPMIKHREEEEPSDVSARGWFAG